MKKKEIKGILLLFLLFLFVAIYKDYGSGHMKSDGTILRDEIGGEEKEVHLLLEGENLFEDYAYDLLVKPVLVTEEQAQEYIRLAQEEIDEDFKTIDETIPIKKSYQEGLVEAKWSFDSDYVDYQGLVLQELVPQEGIVVVVEARLICGAYEQLYSFPVFIQKEVVSEEEHLIKELNIWMENQMAREGVEEVQLPTEINGITLKWKEEKESITLQVLLLELVAALLIFIGKRQQKVEEEKKRVQVVEMEYPDVVHQLSILLEAGMTIRQAWNTIASQYEGKKQRALIQKSDVLEGICRMNRRLVEGESERAAYEKFAEEIRVGCYYRLMRSLSSNLEKGTADLCTYLEEECRQAYEQRVLNAKRVGEEASTKMLIPLMLMMCVVMGIVLLPAIIEISS